MHIIRKTVKHVEKMWKMVSVVTVLCLISNVKLDNRWTLCYDRWMV